MTGVQTCALPISTVVGGALPWAPAALERPFRAVALAALCFGVVRAAVETASFLARRWHAYFSTIFIDLLTVALYGVIVLGVAATVLEVQLTPLEFRLLSTFVRNPRQVLSREQLLELVWGDTYGVGGDQVKLYIGYLRRKLDPGAPDAAPIETVRGFGYRYTAPAAS